METVQKESEKAIKVEPPPTTLVADTAEDEKLLLASRLVNGLKKEGGKRIPSGDSNGENNSLAGNNAEAGDKSVQNNNTSSYAPGGGSLKIFKDGRCLLELTHRGNSSEGNQWVPTTKKVFWPPPPGSTNTANIPKQENLSRHIDRLCSATSTASSSPLIPSSSPPREVEAVIARHRAKSKPQRYSFSATSEAHAMLNFAVKPPPCIVSIRRKVRGIKRKRRRPRDPVLVAALMLRMEAMAVTKRAARKPFDHDRIKRSARLEKCIAKVQSLPTKKKNPTAPLVQIQSWASSKLSSAKTERKTTTTSLTGTTSKRIKSELCPVTETCTAATMPTASPAHLHPRKSSHHKTPLNTSLHKFDPMKMTSPVASSPTLPTMTAKTLPITPTVARIKGAESGNNVSQTLISSHLVSPDLQRIKFEIGTTPSSHHHQMLLLQQQQQLHKSPKPSSPDPREGSPQFISPRKRYLQHIAEGQPELKRHRLSTESRGSGGSSEGGGSQSPHLLHRNQSPRLTAAAAASPFHHLSQAAALAAAAAAVANSPPRPAARSSSFSIDSLMSGRSPESPSSNSTSPASKLVRPVALPASPARSEHPQLDDHRSTRSPPPRAKSPAVVVPISPYPSTRGPSAELLRLDPRLAHLAGVSADPRLGLTPTGMANAAANGTTGFQTPLATTLMGINPYYSMLTGHAAAAQAAAAAAAASQLAAATSLWTPPVSVPINGGGGAHEAASTSRETSPASTNTASPIASSASITSPPVSSAAASFQRRTLAASLGGSPELLGGLVYRGEPRIAGGGSSSGREESKHGRRSTPSMMETDSGDAPLDLTKR